MGVCPGFPGRYSSSLSHPATTVVQLEDDVLAGELPFHQGCLRHAPPEDGRVDGPGWPLPLPSLMTSRTRVAACSLKTELPEPWTCRRTFCPKATRFPRMPRTSRMSLTELPSTSLTCRPRPSASATSTLRTSSSGLSTGLVSRSSLPGWQPQKAPALRVSPSPPTLMRSRL